MEILWKISFHKGEQIKQVPNSLALASFLMHVAMCILEHSTSKCGRLKIGQDGSSAYDPCGPPANSVNATLRYMIEERWKK